MQLADAAQEAGNHDEAYRFYTRILEIEPENPEAWFGKAVAAGWDSDLRRDRYREVVDGMMRAIKLTPDAELPTTRKRAAEALNEITVAYHSMSLRHTMEFIALDDTWDEHIVRCLAMASALQAAHVFDPSNRQVLRNGVDLVGQMLEGVEYADPYDRDDHGNALTKVRHLPLEAETEIEKLRLDFIQKLQALDPNFRPSKIRKAGEMGWFGCLVTLLVLAGLGYGGWWLVTNVFMNRSSNATTTSEPLGESRPEGPTVALPAGSISAGASAAKSVSPTPVASLAKAKSAPSVKPRMACDPNCFYNMRCMVMSGGSSSAPCCQPVTKVMDGLGAEHLKMCQGGARDTVFPTDPN